MKKKQLLTALTFFVGVITLPLTSRAEIITLLDNSRIYGKVVHYYDGTLTVKSSGNVVLKLPVSKVKSIQFKLPKPRPEYSTPQKTFLRHYKALMSSRMQDYIECFSLQYQTLLMHQLGNLSMKDLQEMQRAAKGVRFTFKKVKYKGNLAVMEVVHTRGKTSETAVVHFVKENGEWKMIPMQGQLPEGKSPQKGSGSN